jgi:hypothetical protein
MVTRPLFPIEKVVEETDMSTRHGGVWGEADAGTEET